MTKLPAILPHHWASSGGHEQAEAQLSIDRERLAMANLSDMELANGVFLVDRNSLELIHFTTAAKERIRWLSAHLAAANLSDADRAASREPENPMKTLLREIFTGWILYAKAWNPETREYERPREACFIEAAGGDYNRGLMLGLFDYWANDIQSLAPHFGLNLERCFAGELYINEDIPPAPAADYWWRDGQWFAPGSLDEHSAADPAAAHSIAVAGVQDDSKPGYLNEGGE